MIPFLTNPFALLALASIPALVMIYRLRRQVQRRMVVSSLMFWESEKNPQDGGRQVQRFRTNKFFFLELLIFLLLCLAALGLQFAFKQSQPSLVVVLDDSYSMLAKSTQTTRDKAFERLEKEFGSGRYPFVRVILAQSKPQVIGGVLTSKAQLRKVLSQWRCQAEIANIGQAVGLALRISGKSSKVLVLTDEKPALTLQPGRVKWISVGQAHGNVAIVNAARSRQQGKEWCLVTLANYSNTNQVVSVKLRVGKTRALLRTLRVPILRQSEKRLTFALPPKTPDLAIELPKDSLAVDNQAILLVHQRRPIRVKLQFRSPDLREVVKKAIEATQQIVWDQNNPTLLLTDIPMLPEIPRHVWTFSVLKGPGKVSSYAGPYVLNQKHPLTQGLSLKGAIWSTTKPLGTLSQPLVYVGKIPLFSASSRLDDGVHIRMWYDPSLSTVHRTPDWPILLWNLISWRQQRQPGLREANVQLGSSAELRVPFGVRTVKVTPPSQQASLPLRVRGATLPLPANKVGVYEVKSGPYTHRYAVNTMSRTESDLSSSQPGTWGGWEGLTTTRRLYQDVSWLFGLLGLALLLVHLYWLSRASKSE